MRFSACLEWLFADEEPEFAGRIRLARKAGLDAIEFWRWSNKDIDAVKTALDETGLSVTGFVAEPMIPLTDPDNKDRFLDGLRESVSVAQRLGAKMLIAQAGNDLPSRSRDDQRAALATCLKAAADVLEGSGVRLGLEPLNTLIDHKGYFLGSTNETLDIIDEVGRPEIGIVYDIYHSAVMGERTEQILEGRVDRVFHVHVADHPGRQDPGSGAIDLKSRLIWVFAQGYEGSVGLEYKPIGKSSETVPKVMAVLSQAMT